MRQKSSDQLQGSLKIFDLDALRAIERQAEHEHVDLMDIAANEVVDWVVARYPVTCRIWVAAGAGNNGGDALFAAHRLHQRGFDVTGIVIAVPVSPATQKAFELCRSAGMNLIEHFSDLSNIQNTPDLIIDGLLGIGLSRAPSPPLTALIEQLNAVNAPILALDVPSGLDAGTGCAAGALIQASDTLTFLGHKSGLWMADGADAVGHVHLADLGWVNGDLDCGTKSPESLGELNLNHRMARSLLIRPRNSHKGRFGSVAIVGGNQGMLGAALLAGRAALSAGVGKVWLNVLDERLAVDPAAPELMIRQALSDVSAATAVAIGPGLGQDDAAHKVFQTAFDLVLSADKTTMVIDADALNIMAQQAEFKYKLQQNQARAILTPHPTEAARLLACSTAEIQANRVLAAQQLAKAYASVVVLKGAGTVIAKPNGSFRVNTSGGSALAVAGQGDVLSGVIAALLAVGVPPFEAASLAVYVHGLAGDRYEQDAGGSIGLSASATVSLISLVLNGWLASN
ncbi:Bifunctional NAD(P)H-hydrate repair enzyme Nnr [Ephemeroptericola cinctiostellae]|uniref:Bifunctional NAD(P)H-hydrate repair enzyme n=1 Tax=Ephemeroptericola cinctiostellae TaxID=2268024 RepID=A0A345DBX5_9BURK|nr:NAD(P)H-hydrate dehydratase [Ephemeroptericola cinctiostellae]AXF85863.1 Bifunctional NAD(P)H-hydrate repair enzyme Nnr [Ephemeroptericola cinctiostellae]